MVLKYFIKTFGCQQNHADSERIASAFKARGMVKAKSYQEANYVVLNTCMVRQSAENRVYGLAHNLVKIKEKKLKKGIVYKIIVTGCMVGLITRDKTGRFLRKAKKAMPVVDEFMPINEVGFDFAPLRVSKTEGYVPISNGCNNFCTYCIVPFTRGREISRPYEDIISECKNLKKKGYKKITLLGQNVNSYGSDLILKEKNTLSDFLKNKKTIYIKHLGRYRIPTLFPHLLEEVAGMNFEKVDFISSNPWDFPDQLINVIAQNKNITRTLHLAVQSGDDKILKKMNRWYTAEEYINLTKKIKKKIPEIKFTTDIIVGFCGETEKQFQNTVKLAKKINFEKAYISIYSSRFGTAATKVFKDDVPHKIKRERWRELDKIINWRHYQK